jgi:nucleoside-diphosphate-sugar epimerase
LTKFEDFVDIAVAGNESLLASALKAGPQLTSVVVTSSTIAVTNPKDELEYTFTEKDFASAALEQAIKNKEAGIASPSGLLYGASKTAAERIIWKFRDTHKVSPPIAEGTYDRELTAPSLRFPSQPSILPWYSVPQ